MSKSYKPITLSPWIGDVIGSQRIGVKAVAGDEFPELPWYVEAIKPRKRDFWKVLRGTYQPRLAVGRRTNLRHADAWLRWAWRPRLLAPPFFDSALRKP